MDSLSSRERRRVLVDADVLADFLAGEGADDAVQGLISAKRLAVPSVVLYEIARGTETRQDEADIRRVVRGAAIYPLGELEARRAAEVWRYLSARGEGIGERDTLIAGTCLARRLPLFTRNVRHFGRVKPLGLVLWSP